MRREAVGAVVTGPGETPHVESILLDPPGAGEVVVRIVASGVCHSDRWAIQHGNWGSPFPMLLGHEGAGLIEEVGPDVASLAPGDPVLLAWAVPCGQCRGCLRGLPRTCSHSWEQPPRLRRGANGDSVTGTLSLGTLASHTVVHAAQAIPLPPAADLSRLCLLGCGVSTGIGAAINTGGVRSGDTVAVIGLGGIGLAALQGARIAGASRLIAVDVVAAKLEQARTFGATDVIDASYGDVAKAVRRLTGGDGVDLALEATGVPAVVPQAVAMLARGGTAVAIGVPPPDSTVTIRWSGGAGAAYPTKSTLRITDGGDPLLEDFVRWIGWAVDGRLDLNGMVTRELELTDAGIAEAFRAMLAGEVVRSVVRMT
ncbi:MAG: alcohol dehydrogenase catalytic domain-containing protein [Actinomycetota bacterium]|nr:alcohol dehydrogenase catalytic domain-containing protein [Actinomycetota bacterium]